jgi:hypothetical protein
MKSWANFACIQQQKLWEVFRKWSQDPFYRPSSNDQDFFWENSEVKRIQFNSIWAFFRKIFPEHVNKDGLKDDIPENDLGSILFGIWYKKVTKCLSCGSDSVKQAYRDTIGHTNRHLTLQESLHGLLKESTRSFCLHCKKQNAECYTQDILTRYPPFLYIEIDSRSGLQRTVSLGEEEYDLISIISGDGSHFVAHLEMPCRSA